MAEQIDLSTAEVTPDNNLYKVIRLHLYFDEKLIEIRLLGQNNEQISFTYSGDEASNLMIALNKANLSTKSLHKRIMEKLIADVKLDGTISGAPD